METMTPPRLDTPERRQERKDEALVSRIGSLEIDWMLNLSPVECPPRFVGHRFVTPEGATDRPVD